LDEVRSGDVNTKVECLRALSSMFRQLGVDDPLVDELDAVLSKIPYVKSLDVIQPEHHNYVVDALKKARDILSNMESYYISGYNKLSHLIDVLTGGLVTYHTTPFPLTSMYNIFIADFSSDYSKSISDSVT
jgi:hypothetical protein